MASEFGDQDWLCINSIRALCADVIQKPKSGHPGAPLGMAPMAHTLFTRVLACDPSDPDWINRDRFVLSNGHACSLLYTLLHLLGYDLSMDDLKAFRTLGSKTPGHPENTATPGVEATTGPLGQGIGNAVGMGIVRDHLAALFNRDGFPVIDGNIFCFVGDGCLQEGVASEACSLAGHLGLGSLVVLYDDNHITIDGNTSVAFTENVPARFEAYGWHVQTVTEGNTDLAGILSAINAAVAETARPSFIAVKTTIGLGAAKQDTPKVHGSPLGDEDIRNLKTKFGLDPDLAFHVPDEVAGVYHAAAARGTAKHKAWTEMMVQYADAHPTLAAELERRCLGALPAGMDWDTVLPHFTEADKPLATRKLSEMCLNALAGTLPELIGGSADLSASNLTWLKGEEAFQKDCRTGRNICYGVREHGMCAVTNGICAFGACLPYAATFFNFIGYAAGAIRCAALGHFRQILVMTHDSVGVGEDGPTHQPIEPLMAWRHTPNVLVIRPADGNEVAGAYRMAVETTDRPTILVLSRQAVPQLPGSTAAGVMGGAYVVTEEQCPHAPESSQHDPPDAILVGTGTEVSLCCAAAKELASGPAGLKIRVVSMPSWELFNQQTAEYRSEVLTPGIPVVSVEAGSTYGWARYAHVNIGIDSFGVSAPAKVAMEHFGLTVQNVADRTRVMCARYSHRSAPGLAGVSSGLGV